MQRYKLCVQYKGCKYIGWAKQDVAKNTIQNLLEEACQRIVYLHPSQKNLKIKKDVHVNPKALAKAKIPKVHGSSRTDSGVHALKNTAFVDLERIDLITGEIMPCFDEQFIQTQLNHYLRDEAIRVTRVEKAPPTYHVKNTLERTYMYRILYYSQCINPFVGELAWELFQLKKPFHSMWNIEEMRKAAKYFEGTHDFSSFRSVTSQNENKDPVKTIYNMDVQVIDWGSQSGAAEAASSPILTGVASNEVFPFLYFNPFAQDAHEVRIMVRGKSFVHHQVRLMVHVLYRVGMGELKAEQIPEIINMKNRDETRSMAPPHGLFLVDVKDELDKI